MGKVEAWGIAVVGGIVANNPSDPEAASMEVSETKLVNFAEKTRFDVTSEFKFPDPSEGGGVGDDLAVLGLTLVPPDISTLQNSNGTWNGVVPNYRFSANDTGEIFNSLDEVPGLTKSEDIRLTKGIALYNKQKVIPKLKGMVGDSSHSVFQLDPNQLLTVSSGYKVLITRPLEI